MTPEQVIKLVELDDTECDDVDCSICMDCAKLIAAESQRELAAVRERVMALQTFVEKVSKANWNDAPGNTSNTLFSLMSEARKLMGNPIKPAKIFQDYQEPPHA